MATNPLLMSEKIGNGKFKYHMLGVVIQGDEKDEAAAKKECDEQVLEIVKHLEKAVALDANTWDYESLQITVSAKTKEDADMSAANTCVNRLMKGEPLTGKVKKAEKPAK